MFHGIHKVCFYCWRFHVWFWKPTSKSLVVAFGFMIFCHKKLPSCVCCTLNCTLLNVLNWLKGGHWYMVTSYAPAASHLQYLWPALVKQGTCRKRQATDFAFSTNQYCIVFMISDNPQDQYFFLSGWMHLKGIGHNYWFHLLCKQNQTLVPDNWFSVSPEQVTFLQFMFIALKQ